MLDGRGSSKLVLSDMHKIVSSHTSCTAETHRVKGKINLYIATALFGYSQVSSKCEYHSYITGTQLYSRPGLPTGREFKGTETVVTRGPERVLP